MFICNYPNLVLSIFLSCLILGSFITNRAFNKYRHYLIVNYYIYEQKCPYMLYMCQASDALLSPGVAGRDLVIPTVHPKHRKGGGGTLWTP